MKKLTLIVAGLALATASFACDGKGKSACCKGKNKTECKKEAKSEKAGAKKDKTAMK